MSEFKLPPLPPEASLKSQAVWEHLVEAQLAMMELKYFAKTFTNQEILINAVGLLEAKASSEIEGIRATLDEICLAGIFDGDFIPFSTRDVRDYMDAMRRGFELVREQQSLTVNTICEIQQVLEHYTSGLRMESGTVLQNPSSGQIVYVPPQDFGEIMDLLRNLERVFNEDDFWSETAPLIRMAAAHYQFESIHPFYDGNGRTGRILNVLYLVLKGGLDAPVLSLSRFILKRRKDYYRLFREVRQNGDWEGFVLFMLDSVAEASRATLRMVQEISRTMDETRRKIEALRFASPALLDALFLFPYTRTELFAQRLGVHRTTAAARLKALVELGVLEKLTIDRKTYYVNRALFDVLNQS